MEQDRGLRITTWNVNGIRNPFGYQPWRQDKSFAAMFEILEADIVVMQETKIQRKDLRDDMVLVPGWDVYFSLPKHKKGYSGVAVYTRNSICAPIRAEEGITGILTPPNSSTSFCDLPEDEQIGGYPTQSQLRDCTLDTATLDSEGRCVILEFPAFVLIGTYCPATRNDSRDEFRLGFLAALDARVRNLIAMGKKVFLTGDLNIVREEMDSANLEEQLKKRDMSLEMYFSAPARKMLNQLLVGGKVYGEREEGREKPVMWDICRGFHPHRKGMYTCWETKINARPGNFGSRIDYVLCGEDYKDWFKDSNIQEGLMGSDHCPVYAVLKQKVQQNGTEVDIRDIMSPGMFKDGLRQRDWLPRDLLPMSAKLIPEFDRRRSIRDMFTRKPTLPSEGIEVEDNNVMDRLSKQPSSTHATSLGLEPITHSKAMSMDTTIPLFESPDEQEVSTQSTLVATSQSRTAIKSPAKRATESTPSRPQKKGKSTAVSKGSTATKGPPGKGQSSLMGFFKPKTPQLDGPSESQTSIGDTESDAASVAASEPPTPKTKSTSILPEASESPSRSLERNEDAFIDPIVAKEGWSKLLSKRVVPRCEHNEPCISFVTKKPGINCGRSFYMCPRPLGPSGQKERNSQWRCGTFIWSSDWTGDGT